MLTAQMTASQLANALETYIKMRSGLFLQIGWGRSPALNDFVAKLIGKSVLIFTDGSVLCSQERGVGPGACAAVMCPLQGDGGQRIFTKAVGKHTDILSREVEGIVLGVENVVEYYRGTCFRKTEEVLYIPVSYTHLTLPTNREV